jgi:hypothetical protein
MINFIFIINFFEIQMLIKIYINLVKFIKV